MTAADDYANKLEIPTGNLSLKRKIRIAACIAFKEGYNYASLSPQGQMREALEKAWDAGEVYGRQELMATERGIKIEAPDKKEYFTTALDSLPGENENK